MSLTSVLGAAWASGDPNEVSELAGRLAALAGQADSARTILLSGSVLQWVGAAADLFQQEFGRLPVELESVTSAFSVAAGALNLYADQLEVAQSEALIISEQIDDLKADLAQTEKALQGSPDSACQPALEERVWTLNAELGQLALQGRAIQEGLSDAANQCVATIQSVGRDGIGSKVFRWGGDRLADVRDAASYDAKAITHFSGQVVKAFEAPLGELVSATAAFAKNRSWTNLARVLRATSEVTGEVALVVGLLALAMTGAGVVADAGILAVLAGYAGDAALVAGAGTVGADVMSKARDRDKVSDGEVFSDSVGLGLSIATLGTGRLLSSASKDARVAKGVEKASRPPTVKQQVSGYFSWSDKVAKAQRELTDEWAGLRNDATMPVITHDPATGKLTLPLINRLDDYQKWTAKFLSPRTARLTLLHNVSHLVEDAHDWQGLLGPAGSESGS